MLAKISSIFSLGHSSTTGLLKFPLKDTYTKTSFLIPRPIVIKVVGVKNTIIILSIKRSPHDQHNNIIKQNSTASTINTPYGTVLRIPIRDSVPFWPLDPDSRSRMEKIQNPESGMNIPDQIYENLVQFLGLKILWCNSGYGILSTLGPGWKSRIQDKYPVSATLTGYNKFNDRYQHLRVSTM